MSHNFPLSYFLYKMQDSALIIFRFHLLIEYLAISINHNRSASTFSYIDFPSRIQYSPRNYFVMIPRSTMPSGHSMNISTGIPGCINAASISYISSNHTSSSWYNIIPIRTVVYVSVATSENDYL